MLEWKAIRKGKRFCSPMCVRGCTRAEYLKAKESAGKLAKKLGKGWKPDVWENLGWHWRVVNGGLKVAVWTLNEIKGYTAYLGEPDSPFGRWSKYGDSPRAAIENVIAKATEERDLINDCIKACEASR